MLIGSRCIPNGTHTNHCWANLAHASKVIKNSGVLSLWKIQEGFTAQLMINSESWVPVAYLVEQWSGMPGLWVRLILNNIFLLPSFLPDLKMSVELSRSFFFGVSPMRSNIFSSASTSEGSPYTVTHPYNKYIHVHVYTVTHPYNNYIHVHVYTVTHPYNIMYVHTCMYSTCSCIHCNTSL